jgi:large subunit ribosomal protein L25
MGMVEALAIGASRRTEKGSRAAQRARAEGKVPGVLYGHKEEVVWLSVDTTTLETLLRKGGHGLLELNLDGKTEYAVIKDLQWDVFGREILHVDFGRVSKHEKIVVEVPLVLKGVAPGLTEGGVLDQPMHSIEIRCPADNIQEQVVVHINQLHLGGSIFVKDLTLPTGAEALVDGDQVVVHIAKAKTDEEIAAAEAGTAEPELIRREKGEEEGEGE